jgi:hypothetical protein
MRDLSLAQNIGYCWGTEELTGASASALMPVYRHPLFFLDEVFKKDVGLASLKELPNTIVSSSFSVFTYNVPS